MEFEFDKEMDAILRRARVGEAVTSTDAHLDADEISAYAENAVSEAARMRYTAHLADCARCRKILSNVITLNSEAETETASSVVAAAVKVEKTPWYRRFFAFPQAAYAMGAMVLLFSGFFVYLVLQNLSPADRAAVSYSTNTANRAAPQNAPALSSNANTAANTSGLTANTSVPMNAPANTGNTAPLSSSNSTVTAATPAERKLAEAETDAPVTDVQPMMTPAATPAAKPMVKDEDADDKNLAKQQQNQPSPAGAVREEKNKRDKEEAFRMNESAEGRKDQQKAKTMRSAPEDAKKRAGEQRSVGGKTFNNVGGIWFDAAYTNQKQKTVRRGTSEYQKLDAGLRSIADQLGGTVVVLWKSKAYRIQ